MKYGDYKQKNLFDWHFISFAQLNEIKVCESKKFKPKYTNIGILIQFTFGSIRNSRSFR